MSVTGPAMVAFELEQLELDAGQLKVAGRWSGIRGRRFVRPSLSLIGGDRSARVLAELEHKPWAPADGEIWIAAFPWSGSAPAGAEFELSVAPDICVRLPSPRMGAEGDLVLEAFRPADAPDGGGSRRSRPRRPTETPPRTDRKAQARPDPESARREDVARTERDEAALRTRQAEARQAELARQWERAIEQRDRALSERDEVRSERDQARSERDRAVAERDAVAAELRAALAELERRRDTPAPEPVSTSPQPVSIPAEATAPVSTPSQPPTPLVTRSDARVASSWMARMLALAAIAVVVLVLLLTIVAK
jgi:hypothetical protein